MACAQDDAGGLHLAIVIRCLLDRVLSSPIALTEAAWQAVWNLLATQGKHRLAIDHVDL